MKGQASELERMGIEAYLDNYRRKELLRFLTCGSVDDGKSTLIGRLLYDSGAIFEDQLAAAKRDSLKYGTTGEELDYALLIDGLEAERQQGITIDVAYRYFTTERRKFIIADTPGHEQYTRNMATGAANADLAVILIDARKGVLDQTRRHAFIASLLGIRHLVVAVNKMDLVDFDQATFEAIRRDCMAFTAKLQISDLHFIPLSALTGDNVVVESERMPWYRGGSLLNFLENVHIASDRNLIDLRFPVQYVLRPNLDFRGYSGTVASGILRVGDRIVALPSGKSSTVKSITTFDGPLEQATASMAVTVELQEQIDISRGDMLVAPNNAPQLRREIEAMVVWMAEKPLQAGQSFLLKHTTLQTTAHIAEVRYRMDINAIHRANADQIGLNEIGRIALETTQPLACDAYAKNPTTGAFILIDRLTNATMGAGMIVDRNPAERALGLHQPAADARTNIQPLQLGAVTARQRSQRLGQTPFTLWLTGLPRAGKSSIAFALETALFERGHLTQVLDGETLRMGLNRDLGFTPPDRREHLRRVAEMARVLNDTGVIVIAALISPLIKDREQARDILGERYLEVYCDAPLSVCEARDQGGLFARARAGEVANVTGVDAPYEAPSDPFVILDATQPVAASVERLLSSLTEHRLLKP